MSRLAAAVARVPIGFALLFCAGCIALPLLAMLRETLFGPDGFTLEPWRTIFESQVDREQMLYSLWLGTAATSLAFVFGFGHAWLTERTDLPAARVLGPLGFAPLIVPPILVAMGFADFLPASGFWICVLILGTSYAPFVAVMTARGLRSIDGRAYEAALVARGRRAADRTLIRSILPEVAAGCLFAFIFVISEHGVPEFLTVKGKAWHTYAEGMFARWTRRATGMAHEDIVSPIVAAVPLVLVIVVALFLALRLRAHSALRTDFRPLPPRSLGSWRWPALLLPLTYLGAGIGVPVVVMLRWAMGSTQRLEPMSSEYLRRSFQGAVEQSGGDLRHTLILGGVTAVLALLVALPLARVAARRTAIVDYLAVLPLAVPAVILAIGFVKVYNTPTAGRVYDAIGYDYYDGMGIVASAYAARFLPFGVLTLSHAIRRQPRSLDESALMSGRGRLARGLFIHQPLMLPAVWSVACLLFILGVRELDLAVVLPGGNETVVRRLSNIVHFGGEDAGGALALMLLLAAVLVPLLTVILTGRKLRSLS